MYLDSDRLAKASVDEICRLACREEMVDVCPVQGLGELLTVSASLSLENFGLRLSLPVYHFTSCMHGKTLTESTDSTPAFESIFAR